MSEWACDRIEELEAEVERLRNRMLETERDQHIINAATVYVSKEVQADAAKRERAYADLFYAIYPERKR